MEISSERHDLARVDSPVWYMVSISSSVIQVFQCSVRTSRVLSPRVSLRNTVKSNHRFCRPPSNIHSREVPLVPGISSSLRDEPILGHPLLKNEPVAAVDGCRGLASAKEYSVSLRMSAKKVSASRTPTDTFQWPCCFPNPTQEEARQHKFQQLPLSRSPKPMRRSRLRSFHLPSVRQFQHRFRHP